MNSHQDRQHSADHTRSQQNTGESSQSIQPKLASPALSSYPWGHLLPHRGNESHHDTTSQHLHCARHANDSIYNDSEDAPDSPLTTTFTTYTVYSSTHSRSTTPDDTHSRSHGPPSSQASTSSPSSFSEEQFRHTSQRGNLRSTNDGSWPPSHKNRTLHRKQCSYDLHDDFLTHALPANIQAMRRMRSESVQSMSSDARHSGHSNRCPSFNRSLQIRNHS